MNTFCVDISEDGEHFLASSLRFCSKCSPSSEISTQNVLIDSNILLPSFPYLQHILLPSCHWHQHRRLPCCWRNDRFRLNGVPWTMVRILQYVRDLPGCFRSWSKVCSCNLYSSRRNCWGQK